MSDSKNEARRIAAIVKAREPLTQLCNERLISDEGCAWVTEALDPFHDFELPHLRGFPDVATEPTVVVRTKQALSIAAPPGLGTDPTVTWDCHLWQSPADWCQSAAKSTTYGVRANTGNPGTPPGPSPGTGNYAIPSAGTVDYLSDQHGGSAGSITARMDGLVINSVPSADPTGNGANHTYTPLHCPLTAGGGYQCQNINLDRYLDFADTDLGVYRVIAQGFEVVNTTAQISKQGAVTVYEYGNSYEVGGATHHVELVPGDYAISTPPDQMRTGHHPTTWFRCPPNTLAEAKIMPGAHTWAAQDGVYMQGKFQTDNPFQAATDRPFIIQQNERFGATDSGYLYSSPTATAPEMGCFSSVPPYNPLGAKTSYNNQNPRVHFSRMNAKGAYFTGLSAQTTLLVTWRCVLERLPSANKPQFLALAQPSAQFDPQALVLYNMVANAMPPGCPQGYNDAGKWFRWISDNARKAIPKIYPVVRMASMIANAIPNPSAQALGGGLGTLANLMKPHAQGQSAQRIQNAARQMAARKVAAARAGNGRKPAVGNYTKPSPRGQVPGGRNGLN